MHNRSITKNKIFSTLMALALGVVFVCSFASNAFAATLYDLEINDGIVAARTPSKVTIDGVRYTTIKEKGGNLYPGSYALASDITLTNPLEVTNGGDSDEATTIILNGHSLIGMLDSDEPAIIVGEGSKLIIKDKEGADGQVIACYTAVSVDDGSVTLENADITSCENAGILASNADITLSGDSTLSGNLCAVSCGNSVSFTINGNVSITNNETGILLSSDTQFNIGNGLTVTDNSTAGILCNENQKITIASEYDESSVINAEISIKNSEGKFSDVKLVFPSELKLFRNSFTGCNENTVSTIISDTASKHVAVQSINCSGHKYTYTVSGNTINAHCSECDADSKLVFTVDAYYDSTSSSYFVDADSVDSKIYINDDGWDNYKVTAYPRVLYTNTETGESGFEAPSAYGSYTAKMVLLSEENNPNSILAQTEEIPFSMMCSKHSWEYISDGEYIYAKCQNCGGVLAEATLSLNNYDISNLGDKKLDLYDCQGDKFESEIKVAGNNMGLGTFAVVYGYYQEDGSIKYSFDQPTEDGDYTVRIAVLKRANNPNSAIASTAAVSYSYHHHNWTYAEDGDCITANCDKCNGSASVCIDTSEVLYAAREIANGENETFTGNVFYENGWSSIDGIKKYHVLYRNINDTTYTTDSSLLSNSSFACYVKVVLLNDEDDITSVCNSTNEKLCYIANKSIDSSDIQFVSYPESKMKQPSIEQNSSGKVYNVGTVSELYWAVKYAETNATINLTNDIVVNPIVVSDDCKKVYSASDTIYTWEGFGTLSSGFNGTICGNGYTIYGLYSNESSRAGLISAGYDFNVEGITIKDSVFKARFAAGIAAFATANSHNVGISVTDCNVLNCQITGIDNGFCGGIFAYVQFKIDDTYINLTNCVSKCYIKGDDAGGMIGEVRYELQAYLDSNGNIKYLVDYQGWDCYAWLNDCTNLGNVEGKHAGGMIGLQDGSLAFKVGLERCRNLGRIEGSVASGGMVGMSHDTENSKMMTVDLQMCSNIGEIYCNGTGAGGLVGICDAYPSGFAGLNRTKSVTGYYNSYYGATYAVGAAYTYGSNNEYMVTDTTASGSWTSDIQDVTRLTRELAKKVNLCTGFTADSNGNAVLSSWRFYNHVAGEWTTIESADCTSGGEKQQKCLICGKVMNTIYSDAHGHEYENGTCTYCGDAEETNVGSVFSSPTYMVYIISILAIIAVVAVVIYKKKSVNSLK